MQLSRGRIRSDVFATAAAPGASYEFERIRCHRYLIIELVSVDSVGLLQRLTRLMYLFAKEIALRQKQIISMSLLDVSIHFFTC
jgi:hypothetical protein